MLTASAQILFLAASSRDGSRIVAWTTIGVGVGVYLFFRGFKMLQFKRLILNTPASKVRSASMGLVELSGMAVGPSTIPAGITGDPCFYYRATAWEFQRSGNRSEWKRVADESVFIPFFLLDDTGRTLVNAQGANMDLRRNFKNEFGGSFFSSNDTAPATVQDFLLRNTISGKHVRLEEYCIKPEFPLFVVGTFGENTARYDCTPGNHVGAASSSINLRLNSGLMGNGLLKMLRLPGAQMGMDTMPLSSKRAETLPTPQPASRAAAPATSSWLSISMDEVHPPVAAAKCPAITPVAQMTEPETVERPLAPSAVRSATISLPDTAPIDLGANPGPTLSASTAIGKGDAGAPFTISSESQRELVRALGWKSTACIWGGPALAVVCVYILLVTLGRM